MGIWNYRICRLDDGSYGICEVYYDKNGKAMGRTDLQTANGSSPAAVLEDAEAQAPLEKVPEDGAIDEWGDALREVGLSKQGPH